MALRVRARDAEPETPLRADGGGGSSLESSVSRSSATFSLPGAERAVCHDHPQRIDAGSRSISKKVAST
jgi:hypothetical protein